MNFSERDEEETRRMVGGSKRTDREPGRRAKASSAAKRRRHVVPPATLNDAFEVVGVLIPRALNLLKGELLELGLAFRRRRVVTLRVGDPIGRLFARIFGFWRDDRVNEASKVRGGHRGRGEFRGDAHLASWDLRWQPPRAASRRPAAWMLLFLLRPFWCARGAGRGGRRGLVGLAV